MSRPIATINRVRQENEAVEADTRADLKILADKIDHLSALVATMHAIAPERLAAGSPPTSLS